MPRLPQRGGRKNSHLPIGKQWLRCKDCSQQFVPDAVWRKVSDETKALLGRLLLERLSLADITRAIQRREPFS